MLDLRRGGRRGHKRFVYLGDDSRRTEDLGDESEVLEEEIEDIKSILYSLLDCN